MQKLFKSFLFLLVVLVAPVVANAAEVSVTDEESLILALTNVSEETIVNVMNDIEVKTKVAVTGIGPVTIKGNGYKVYATGNNTDRVFELTAGDELLNVTFENMTIENQYYGGKKAARGVDTRTDNITLTFDTVTINTLSSGNNQPITIGGADQEGITVNIKNSKLNAGSAGYAVISFVKANIMIEDSNLEGYSALYMQAGTNGSVVKITDSKLSSNNTSDEDFNRFATVFLADENITVDIVDSTIEATGTGDAYQSVFSNSVAHGAYVTPNIINVSGEKSVIKANNASEVDDIVDSETGESITNSNEYAYITDGLDITFEPGVTTDVVVSDNKVDTIPSDYLPSNAVITEKEDGSLVVSVKHNVKVNEGVNGKFAVDKVQAILGELVKVTVTPDVDYELETIKVFDVDGKEVNVNSDGTFTMPDSEVTISVTFRENVNPNTADNIFVYFIIGFISLVVIGGVSLKFKKDMN